VAQPHRLSGIDALSHLLSLSLTPSQLNSPRLGGAFKRKRYVSQPTVNLAVAEQIWLGKGREGLELEYAGIR